MTWVVVLGELVVVVDDDGYIEVVDNVDVGPCTDCYT